jgi:hypothetical protein
VICYDNNFTITNKYEIEFFQKIGVSNKKQLICYSPNKKSQKLIKNNIKNIIIKKDESQYIDYYEMSENDKLLAMANNEGTLIYIYDLTNERVLKVFESNFLLI